jgi:Flp pilus assembly protein TadG
VTALRRRRAPGRLRRIWARLCDHRGQATIEFGGMTLYVFIAALFAWQMGLVAWTAVSANNAVRTAERLVSRGDSIDSAQKAGTQSLSGRFLGSHSTLRVVTDTSTGQLEAVAHVGIPLILPGLKSGLSIPAHAELPTTG